MHKEMRRAIFVFIFMIILTTFYSYYKYKVIKKYYHNMTYIEYILLNREIFITPEDYKND